MNELSGILPLYKPRGMTSHDCVSRLRRLLHFRKIGHTGTLDPDVDGVLVLCLGRATRVAEFLLDYGKTYHGVVSLGRSTSTEDASGDVVDSKPVRSTITEEEIGRVFNELIGPIDQTVPLYSAVKVDGKKLYEYARSGIPVSRPTRCVKIYRLELISGERTARDLIPFIVSCSKGTYVRTLAVTIGEKLGYPAHLQTLTRIKAGPFSLEECVTFEQIETALEQGKFAGLVRPLESALGNLKSWVVDRECEQRIIHGAVLPIPDSFDDQPHAVYNSEGRCLAIYQIHPENRKWVKPLKVLV